MEEIYDMEISHPYPPVVNTNQADKDLLTDKTIDLESKENRVTKFIENTARSTQERRQNFARSDQSLRLP